MLKFVVFSLLLTYISARGNGNYVVENEVAVLNDNNFDEVVKTNDFVMVEFYAPWCGHCKALAPEWDHAAAALKNESIIVAKIDTSNKRCEAITKRYMISGFPTIYFFKYQNKMEYTGAREADAIISWVMKHTGPSATVLTTVDQIGISKRNFDVFVLGYFSDPDSPLVKSFYGAADQKEAIKFFITYSKEIANHLGLRKDALVVLKDFDEGRADLDANELFPSRAQEDMMEFIKANTYPLMSVFYNRDAQKIFSPRIMTHALVFTDTEAAHHAPTIALCTEMARELRGKVQFINILAEDEKKLEYFGVKADSLPAIVAMDVDDMVKYPYSGPFEQTPIMTHLQLVLEREMVDPY